MLFAWGSCAFSRLSGNKRWSWTNRRKTLENSESPWNVCFLILVLVCHLGHFSKVETSIHTWNPAVTPVFVRLTCGLLGQFQNPSENKQTPTTLPSPAPLQDSFSLCSGVRF